MKRREWMRNCIIYMLLAVFLVAASGMGLDEGHQVFFRSSKSGAEVLKPQTFLPDVDLHIFQIEEKTSAIVSVRGLRNSRTDSFSRYNLFFICILAVLLGISRLNQEVFTLHGNRYVQKRRYIICFIQDTDGRKRIS
jgi:hypothetical protein